MKKKLFLGAALIAAIGVANAQTDVTSTYLQNPGFELSAAETSFTHTGAADVSGGLYGWTLGSKEAQYHDIQVCDNTSSASGFGTQVTPAEGNYYFFNRKGWGTITWSLSTTASELPAGKYFFTVDYKAAESQNNNGYKEGKITINVLTESTTLATSGAEVVTCYNPENTYFNTSPWKTKGIWFTVDETSTITIQITEYLNGTNGRADICLDNCKLYKWASDDATNYQNASEATPLDMTYMIPNPDFSSNLDGCERTLTYQNNARATNKYGAFSGYFWENWNGSAGAGKMYQTISGLPNGKYRVKLAAFGKDETTETQGVYLYATGCTGSGTPVTSANPAFYEVDAVVTDGTLEFGLESKGVSQWLGMDNVSLAYLGAIVDPFLNVSTETITFKGASTANLTISGQNLTEDVTLALSSSEGLSLSKSTLTLAEVSAEGGATVTITCSAALAEAVTLTVSSGDLSKTVTLNTTSSLDAAVAGLFMDQSMSNTYTFAFTKGIFGTLNITKPEGVEVIENEEAGTMTVTWDKTTLVDGDIVLSADNMEERIEVLATPNNLISTWDGDNAEGDGSKLIDFGWTQTSADGQTEQTPSWQNYNAGSGVRLMPMPDDYTYNGGKLLGHRIAYLRTWGTVDFEPEFVYNLPVTLETGATYKACALVAWHNNGENPTAKVAIRTAKGKGDDNLATADKYFTTKTAAQQYEFEFKATQTENYLTIALVSTENADGGGYKDCMLAPAYLTIYKTADAPENPTALNGQQLSDMQVCVEKGMLRVLNVAEFSVYNVQGQQVAACAGNETVALPQGVYVVKAAGAVQKVLVK